MGEDAPILEVMRTMRAMRRLKPDPVPDELLERLVEAATWGPSGSNTQAYSFVVVTDRAQMARLAEPWHACVDFYLATAVAPDGMSEEKYGRLKKALRYQSEHFTETPAVIVACYDFGAWQRKVMRNVSDVTQATLKLGPRRSLTLGRGFTRVGAMSEAASVYPSVQNLLLAARANGLGAVITTWHLMLESEFKAVLGIPRNVKTFAIVPVGYPLGRFGEVVRKPAAASIHRDRW
jgi:nitroreductase